MKVALVHYHLQPGGVTRVIENTIEAWKSLGVGPDQYVVLSGRPYPGDKALNTIVVDGLDYVDAKNAPKPTFLKQKMEEAARSALGQLPDVWHVHNHSLGKNAGLTGAVAELAKTGARLLLQPHDFAEDGRPKEFSNLSHARSLLYPTAGQIHYAALNRRDFTFLRKTTLESSSTIHLLANAIPQPPNLENYCGLQNLTDLPENLFLYPVRAVRRKNLGELALLSIAHPEFHFANSLGPTNPSFLPAYLAWIQFASQHQLRLTYGLGEQTETSFPEMVNHASAIISVSVAEGFGLGFLEPWTYGKSLCGRNIGEITSDFAESGVNLDNLYDELWIDRSLVDRQELERSVSNALRSTYRDYRKELPKDAANLAITSISNESMVKFGSLDEKLQKKAITRIRASKIGIESIRNQANLKVLDARTIQRNKDAVMEKFSLSAYGSKVYQIYLSIMESEDDKVIFANGEKMLDQFLNPKRLNLLRT